jgi:hypothetical protein
MTFSDLESHQHHHDGELGCLLPFFVISAAVVEHRCCCHHRI